MKFSSPLLLLLLTVSICSCKKDFLDAKPNTTLVTPTTLADYQALLENIEDINRATPDLLQMSSDDYVFADNTAWQSTAFDTERNSYIWAKDLYEGEKEIKDWNKGYTAIFIVNNVLEGLNHIAPTALNRKDWNNIRGWALFMRSYTMFNLARSFAAAYDSQTAATDPGMVIRLKAGIDEVKPRSSVQQTYDQILSDLSESTGYLQASIDVNYRQRPSKVAAMALFSRIYLSMRKYNEAERYADSTLSLYNVLTDYNTIDADARIPFLMNNEETILHTTSINYYSTVSVGGFNESVTINPSLYSLYNDDDLRKYIYFSTNVKTGRLYMKFGYAGGYTNPFTGLATDEVYLTKAECLARSGKTTDAFAIVNKLLKNRYKSDTFIPLTAANSSDALETILRERRKELVWRSLRWTDLKRLNKEGANIMLKRELNGIDYTLPPNNPRYIFPIPSEEISSSGIQQNIR